MVVVSYNGAEFLPRAILSIGASTGVRPHVIVVDNASTDESREVAAALGATVVTLSRNLGYGAAFNIGVQHSAATWVACSNQDLELDPSALFGLIEAATSHERDSGIPCIASPQLLTPDGLRAETCHRFPTLAHQLVSLLAGDSAAGDRNTGYGDAAQCCDWVSGAFLLGRASTFGAVNGFDPRYFMYVEDLDFFHRLADAGLHCLWVPACTVLHFGAGRSGPPPAAVYAHTLWNLRTYRRDRQGSCAGAVTLLAAVVGSLLRATMWWFRGRSEAEGRLYARMFAGAALTNVLWAVSGGPPGAGQPSAAGKLSPGSPT